MSFPFLLPIQLSLNNGVLELAGIPAGLTAKQITSTADFNNVVQITNPYIKREISKGSLL
jgi:hypothetical protein